MQRLIYVLLIVFACLGHLYSQVPVITTIDKKVGTANTIIGISGSGFGTVKDNIKVSFGPVIAEIISVTDVSVSVKLPPGATYANVIVTNISTGLSASSIDMPLLSFGGRGFTASMLSGKIKYRAESGLNEHCFCDFDNDGLVDIAASNLTYDSLTIFKNASTPSTISFSKKNIDLKSTSYNITCGDLDGDGLKDLVASKAGNEGYQVFVLRNQSSLGNISFGNYASYFAIGKIIKKIALRDLDIDGKPEIIVTSEAGNILSIFKNQSTLGAISFGAVPIQIIVNGASATTNLAVEDLNRDGLPEIIANTFLGESLFILQNKSVVNNIVFDPAQKVSYAAGGNQFVIGDLNLDGMHDIAISNISSGNLTIMLNKTVGIGDVILYSAPFENDGLPGAWGVDIGDLDGDRRPDVIMSSSESQNLALFRNVSGTDDLIWEKTTIVSTEKSKSIKVGDLNKDGKPDISFAGVETPAIVIIQNNSCIEPIISANNPLMVCKGVPLRLQVPEGIGVTYEWSLNKAIISGANNYFFDPVTSGDYNVSITNSDASCKKTSPDSTVAIFDPNGTTNPTVKIISGDSAICINGAVELQVEGNFLEYTWSTGEKTKSIVATKAQKYTVDLKVTGGCNAVGEILIKEYATPQIVIDAPKSEIKVGEKLQLQASGADQYHWRQLPGLVDSLISNPEVAPTVTTTYKVLGKNEMGCIGEAEFTVVVNEDNLSVTPLKIFSPNGDGVQDFWTIERIEDYTDFKVSIFSNSGQLLFQAMPYPNNWDGTAMGKRMPDGDYYYLIESPNSSKKKTGGFLLVR